MEISVDSVPVVPPSDSLFFPYQVAILGELRTAHILQ